MSEDISQFYIDNDGTFEYDKDLPYVVVNVNNELAGRFPNKIAAERYLEAIERYGRIIETTVRDAIVGGWGYIDHKPTHLDSYHRGYEAGKATGEAPSAPSISVPEETPAPVTDVRPHSRACGFRRHDHGPDCHPNCPTCGGKTP